MPHATSAEVPRFHLVRFFEGFSVLLPRSPIVARTVVSNSLACAINRYNRKLYDDANDGCENTRCCFLKSSFCVLRWERLTPPIFCVFSLPPAIPLHNYSTTRRSTAQTTMSISCCQRSLRRVNDACGALWNKKRMMHECKVTWVDEPGIHDWSVTWRPPRIEPVAVFFCTFDGVDIHCPCLATAPQSRARSKSGQK